MKRSSLCAACLAYTQVYVDTSAMDWLWPREGQASRSLEGEDFMRARLHGAHLRA